MEAREEEGQGEEWPGFDPLPVVLVRLQQLEAQGQPMAALDSPDSHEVASALRLLGQQGRGLKAAWEQRQQRLQEGLELQRFSREVDGFTATCANHEAFLQLDSLGVWSQGCAAGVLRPHHWRELGSQAGQEASGPAVGEMVLTAILPA